MKVNRVGDTYFANIQIFYTLSHLENDRDVSAFQRKTRLSSRAQLVCVFSHVQNGTPKLTHKGCLLQRVSLGALSDVTVVLEMRQSIEGRMIWVEGRFCVFPLAC